MAAVAVVAVAAAVPAASSSAGSAYGSGSDSSGRMQCRRQEEITAPKDWFARMRKRTYAGAALNVLFCLSGESFFWLGTKLRHVALFSKLKNWSGVFKTVEGTDLGGGLAYGCVHTIRQAIAPQKKD